MKSPKLGYPDTNKLYTLFMDASKYAWSAVLPQGNVSVINGKIIKHQHPIINISLIFQGSQMNWAAVTRKAYSIYVKVKKSSFYLSDAMITLRSDHLPLKRFL